MYRYIIMPMNKTVRKRSNKQIYRSRVKRSPCRGKKSSCRVKYGCRKTKSGKRSSYCRKRSNRRA